MGAGGLKLLVLVCAFFVCGFGAVLRQEVGEELKSFRLRQKRQVNDAGGIREVKMLDIKSKIAMRFASTTIVCRITNKGANSERITFPLEFTDTAYITEFNVVVDGDDETYYGEIRDRCEGSDRYTFSASGDVPPDADPLWNNFTTGVYLRPRGHATFTVTYQEILRRVRGSYSLVISVKPGHVVSDFGIDVEVTELQGISYINAGFFNFSTSAAEDSSGLLLFSSVLYGGRDTLNSQNTAIDSILGDDVNRVFLSEYITNKNNQNKRASFKYSPSKSEQQAFNPDLGMYGVFVLTYDVEHDDVSPGDVMVSDEYFVHYFSPSGLQALPKDVVFAFDVSASMYGRKLTQTKMALKTILDDLSVTDRFNILTFSTEIEVWEQNRLLEANQGNIDRAKTHVENLVSIASTNINGALVEGLRLLHNAAGGARTSVCILFLLTDGTATIGETNSRAILRNTRNENQNDCSIITLGFGKRDSDVDFPFLTRIALANKGISRRIFDGVDVPTQLKGVYDEVATPLLRDVTISYLENSVDLATLTQTQFQNFFNGSELSVAGLLADSQLTEIPVRVSATGSTGSGINNIGDVTMEERIDVANRPSSISNRHVPQDFVERSWAIHTLEEKLRNLEITEDEKERNLYLTRAFQLSQSYNLLTPVTSFKFINTKGQSKVPDGFGWEFVGSRYNTAEKDKLGSESEFCVGEHHPTQSPPDYEGVDIEMIDIETQIALRYARTKVTARIVHENQGNVNLRFSFQIPRYAFVTNVIATSRGKTYDTSIVFDENSKKRVLDAKGRIPRIPTMETVVVSALAPPNIPITFEITYEELLERNDGLFEYRLNLYPRHIVNFFRIAVYVTEPQQIESLDAKFENYVDNGQDIALTNEVTRTGNTARQLLYDFTVEEQNNHIDSSGGIKGDMVVKYDVRHDTSGGYMEAKDGYFVQYFSPNGLREIAKHVVFVIDTSASMGLGEKLRQTKEAVKSAIDDLGANDRFNVISFADQPKSWRQNGLAEAYTNNKVDAKNFINRLTDGGDTNLYSALIKADEVLDRGARDVSDSDDEIYSMIILFTDGKPSIGIIDTDELVRQVSDSINSAHALYAFSFGPDADFEFLVRLAAQNNGRATKIYVDNEAAKSLEDLYSKISSALLMDTNFQYSSGKVDVDSLTAVTSKPYFEGSEIPSAGKLEEDASGVLTGTVTGRTNTGRRRTFQADTSITNPSPEMNSQYVPNDVVERIWAYLRVRFLLDRYARTDDPMLAAEIISVSQKYKFFTPLTPLVFVDPTTKREVNDGSLSHPLVTFSSDDFALFNALVRDYKPLVTEEPPVVPSGIILEQSDGIDLRQFNIKCTIGARYSITEAFKLFDNLSSRKGRVVFRFDMPGDAVISAFKMDIEGSTYSSDAFDMSIFPTTHQGPLDINGNGGFVEHRGGSKMLVVSVAVGPNGRAQFQVTYERLLRRTKGKYAEVIKLYPGELVEDFNIDVRIAEPAGIRFTHASVLFTNSQNVPKRRNLPSAVIQERSTVNAVKFSPSEKEQAAYSDTGIKGEFVVQYDVIHGNDGGDIQLYNDYFVHHFSPNILQALRKNVVFVIDVSDSMNGLKLKQVKKAFTTILNDVRPNDRFNILAFSNTVVPFSVDMVEASQQNIRDAQQFVEDLNPLDGTNLNRAVLDGINQLRKENERPEQTAQDEDVLGIVILLTDGTPTQGEIVLDRIIQNVEDAGRGQPEYSIFCLGFGNDVDMEFLNRLALTSYGVARSIPASSNAVELLEGFYDEVATPLLYDIQVFYLDGIAADLSTRVFKTYFNGSEIVVVGRLNSVRQRDVLISRIKTISRDTDFEATADAKRPPDEFQYNARYPEDMMARAWAYYTLLELFESYVEAQGPGTFIKNEITTRAERYNFLTSNNFTFYHVKQDSDQEKVMRIVERGYGDMMPIRPELYTYCENRRNEKSWCDNDPHFVVHVPRSNTSVCFDLYGNPDDVFSLVADPSKGIFVNGLLIGEEQDQGAAKHIKTYFGQIAFVKDPPNNPSSKYSDILINPSEILINNEIRLHWRKSRNLKIRDISIQINGEHANITLAPGVNFVVRRHIPKESFSKPAYLGIYMEDASGFSDGIHGLMGQFEHATVDVKVHRKTSEDEEQRGVLTIRGQEVKVKLSGRTDNLRKQKKECWKVEKNGLGFIRGHYTDYIQSDLFSTAM